MASRTKTIRVLICIRHTLFREGIKALLHEGVATEIVGEAGTGKEALDLLERLRPDVVLLDASLTDSSGSEVTRRIKSVDPQVEVLIVTMQDDELLISGCLEAGATAFLRKDDEALQLRQAINTARRRTQHAA
jgi:DNA-binding NarL/FixJ family response regulator